MLIHTFLTTVKFVETVAMKGLRHYTFLDLSNESTTGIHAYISTAYWVLLMMFKLMNGYIKEIKADEFLI